MNKAMHQGLGDWAWWLWSSPASAFPHSLAKGCALKPTAQPTALEETHPPTHSFDPTDAARVVALASPDARARALPRERFPACLTSRRWGASIPTPEPTSRRLRPLTTPPACISRSPPRRPRIALVVCPPSSRPSQTCRPPRRRTVPRAFRHPRRCACGSSLRHCCCSPTATTYFWRARAAWAFEGARARRAAIFGVLGP